MTNRTKRPSPDPAKVRALRLQGLSQDAIAAQLGCTRIQVRWALGITSKGENSPTQQRRREEFAREAAAARASGVPTGLGAEGTGGQWQNVDAFDRGEYPDDDAPDTEPPEDHPRVSVEDVVRDGGSGLYAFGTALERAGAEAFIRLGSVEAAAAELHLTPDQLRAHLSELHRRAASRGWSPGHLATLATPAGYNIRGVSTQVDASGAIISQWVKTQRDPQHKFEQMLEAITALADPLRGLAEPVTVTSDFASDDLLCVYPMGDPHLGMYAWAEETGQDFDLSIATRDLYSAVDSLVSRAPASREALIINLGDFFHADNSSNMTTRSHHALDVDTRWAKVLKAGVLTMRRCIDRALEKHERVRVICEIGNHDDHSSIMLAITLSNYYEREPRVDIDTSPAKFHWHRFGENLIGVTHGDTVKKQDLPGVMACDRREDWGETRHRYWYCGHVHHDSLKEYPGVTVETFRTMAPGDSWHRSKGYRSGQDMKLDVLHRKYGRVRRDVVGIYQLRERPE